MGLQGAREAGKARLVTNFDITDYTSELEVLRSITQAGTPLHAQANCCMSCTRPKWWLLCVVLGAALGRLGLTPLAVTAQEELVGALASDRRVPVYVAWHPCRLPQACRTELM
jgi:hypothetical protein